MRDGALTNVKDPRAGKQEGSGGMEHRAAPENVGYFIINWN